MKIYEYEVPQSVEDACIKAMIGEFTALQIEMAAIRAGAPNYGKGGTSVANRIADRLLQRERKAGRIKVAGNKKGWTAVSKEGE